MLRLCCAYAAPTLRLPIDRTGRPYHQPYHPLPNRTACRQPTLNPHTQTITIFNKDTVTYGGLSGLIGRYLVLQKEMLVARCAAGGPAAWLRAATSGLAALYMIRAAGNVAGQAKEAVDEDGDGTVSIGEVKSFARRWLAALRPGAGAGEPEPED